MNPYLSTDETEIDLLDLGKYLLSLRRIVWILLAGVLCALCLGSYKYFAQKKAVIKHEQTQAQAESESETETETETEPTLEIEFDPQQYKDELKTYEAQSELVAVSNESIRSLFKEHEKYLKNSPYMQLDPYHVWRAQAMYQITSMDRFYPAYQIKELYRYELVETDYLEDLAKKRGIKPEYLREFVGASGAGSATAPGGSTSDIVIREADDDDRMTSELLVLTATGSSKDDAQELLDVMMEEIQSAREKFTSEYPHELRRLSEYCTETVDTSIRNAQKDHEAYSQTLLTQLKDNRDRANFFEKPKSEEELWEEAESEWKAKKELSSAPQEMTETEEAEEEKVLETPKKSAVKFALIGLVAGIFIMCLAYAVQYMLRDKLVDYADVQREGFSLIELASIPEQDLSMAAASIRSFTRDRRRVFCTGFAEESVFHEICEGLKERLADYTLVSGRDVITDSASRDKILDCDIVVLVEQKGVTRYSDMRKEVTYLYHADKEIIGMVIC